MTSEFAGIAADFPDPFKLIIRESAASTNDEIRALADLGHSHGVVLIALRQTAGRGRRGATWFASPGDSLAFSILLRPDEPQALWPRLALATGLAVAEAVESFGPAAGIKWPNDVWFGNRKTAGILVEAANNCAIVGIGLNVNTPAFPPELQPIATSLHIETGHPVSRAEVLAAIVTRCAIRFPQIGADFNQMLDGVRQRCVLTGNHVTLKTISGNLDGLVEGIAPGGELLLRTRTGLKHIVHADEIRLA
ncbi:MAG: biotin--[acetyl-CoA-carboxylase] ligase [Verrucomicrobiales bacterium]|nr:biotin--[acetyl-CoA-carboxylase] ligase [Verrucomicrobiota bacterium JB025]